MSLARLEAGEEERQVGSFDAGALLASFCAAMRPVAEQHGLWLKTEGPDSLQVDGDERKVERILNNLLRSAINHTRRGGVTVLWGPVESGPERDCWSFCVEDTGAGLGGEPLASLAAELCHATGRAHEAVKSQGEPVDAAPTEKSESQPLPPDEVADEGVGLAIVKRLCELLDATLELETGPGRGSTYRVTFPMEY